MQVPEHGRDYFLKLFENTIDAGLHFIEEHGHFISIRAPTLSVVNTLCSILGALVGQLANHGGFGEIPMEDVVKTSATNITASNSRTKPASDFNFSQIISKKSTYLERNPDHLLQLFSKIYIFAYVWALGGNFNCPSDDSMAVLDSTELVDTSNVRNSFDTFVHDLCDANPSLRIRLPSGHSSLYNYYVDFDTGQYALWENLVPSNEALIEKYVASQMIISGTVNGLDDPMPNVNDIEYRALVPTIDSVQYSFLVSLLALNGRPVLLSGNTGVGKTAMLRDILKRLSQVGGAGTSPGTILGSVLSTGGSSLLESIVENSSGKDSSKKKTVFVSQLQFSAHTSITRTRNLIHSKLVNRGKNAVGPKTGKKVRKSLSC